MQSLYNFPHLQVHNLRRFHYFYSLVLHLHLLIIKLLCNYSDLHVLQYVCKINFIKKDRCVFFFKKKTYSGVSPCAFTAFTSHPLIFNSNSIILELPLNAAQCKATLCSTSLNDTSAPFNIK